MKSSESIYNVGNDYAQLVLTKTIQPEPKPEPGPGPGPEPEPVWPKQYGALAFYKVDDKIICIINLAYDGTDSCTMPEAIEVDEIRNFSHMSSTSSSVNSCGVFERNLLLL